MNANAIMPIIITAATIPLLDKISTKIPIPFRFFLSVCEHHNTATNAQTAKPLFAE